MDGEDVIYIYIDTQMKYCIYKYTYEILLSNKQWNLVICDDTHGPWGYYAKWDKSDKGRWMPHDFTYMWKLREAKQMRKLHKIETDL